MGNNNSIQSSNTILYEVQLTRKQLKFDHYFRQHYLLHAQTNFYGKKNVIRKIIILENNEEHHELYKEYQNIDRKPFNVIYPMNIAEWIQPNYEGFFCQEKLQRICSPINKISIYFQQYQHNLVDYCKNSKKNKRQHKEKQIQANGSKIQKNQLHEGLQQHQIWFIFNEIARGLEILANNKHAHWYLTPQTIFYNSNQNWFIHDSYYVIGPNHQNFLIYKMKLNNQIISKQTIQAIEKGINIDVNIGHTEDIYCLGYCILYMMGITNYIYKDPLERHERVTKILKEQNKYTDNLVKLVKSMIQPFERNRISIGKIRQRLKPSEKSIIQDSTKLLDRHSSLKILPTKQKLMNSHHVVSYDQLHNNEMRIPNKYEQPQSNKSKEQSSFYNRQINPNMNISRSNYHRAFDNNHKNIIEQKLYPPHQQNRIVRSPDYRINYYTRY